MAEQVDSLVARRIAVEQAPAGANPTEAALIQYLRPRARQNPEQAMKIMAGREVPPREVSQAFADQQIGPVDLPTINVAIGGVNVARKNRGAIGGGAPRPAYEIAMAANAQNSIDQIYNFLEQGTITPAIRTEVFRMLYNDPGYRNLFAEQVGGMAALTGNYAFYLANPGVIPAGITGMLDEIIQLPEFKLKLQELAKKTFDITKPIEDKAATIRIASQTLNKEVAEIEDQLNAKIANSVAQNLGNINNDIDQYRLNAGGLPNARLQDIQNANKLIAQYKSDLSVLDAEMTGQSAALTQAATRGAAQARIPVLTAERQKVAKNLAEAESNKEALEANLKTLTERRNALQAQFDALRTRRTERTTSQTQENAKLAPMENERRLKEQAFIDNITGMFADAAVDALNERLTSINAGYDKLLTERRTQERDALKRQLDDTIRERYFGNLRPVLRPSLRRALSGGPALVVQEREIEGRRTEDDFEVYRDGGPPALVEEMVGADLENQIRTRDNTPAPVALTQAQQKEYENRLREIANERGNEIVLNMLITRQRLSRRLSLDDARLVQTYNPNIFNDVINRNKELREQIEKIAKAEGIDNLTRMPEGVFRKLLAMVTDALGFSKNILIGGSRPY